ncbi:hypothetical protein BP6252_08033 [Coleophoma cylindrospora]|uniref:Mid2 domain-containing protein n=1 Tax=Coleophoma cylindrospora TaxID=1849047 RepID=A0A3D8RBV9_9HELO|nr:hypothetical protein BP6252_08033 [Coleophoma cylindrospora]
MSTLLSHLLSCAVLASLTTALAFNAPSATSVADVEGKLLSSGQISPQPTAAPRLSSELQNRQNNQQSVFVAADNTCGYISGRPEGEFRCPTTDSCVLFPTTGSTYGAVGCCNNEDCGIRRGCVDYDQFYTASACGDDCKRDSFIQKCTAASAPYCNSIKFPLESVVDYFCDSVFVSGYQLARTTFDGQSNRALSTMAFTSSLPFPTSDSSFPTTTLSIGTLTPTPSSNADATISADKTIITIANSSGEVSDAPQQLPTGIIVGGVVGGAIGITVVCLLAFFVFRRKSAHQYTPKSTCPPCISIGSNDKRPRKDREDSTGTTKSFKYAIPTSPMTPLPTTAQTPREPV